MRSVLAADRPGGEVRGGGPESGSGQSRGSGEDGSAGRHEAGAQLARRGSDRGLGPQPGTRSTAGPGSSPRGGEAGSVAGAAPAQQIPVTPRPTSPRGDQGVDPEVSGLG